MYTMDMPRRKNENIESTKRIMPGLNLYLANVIIKEATTISPMATNEAHIFCIGSILLFTNPIHE